MGLGSVFNIAGSALAAQRYALDVTAHNIANVDTPGYSRQNSVIEARRPGSSGRLSFGQGVDTARISRSRDQFVEDQLMQQRSKMSFSKEMDQYVQVMESIFNENTENSMSTILSGFWNSWQDISNNPSGPGERTILYENGVMLSDQFHTLDSDLENFKTDLNNSLKIGVEEINRITNEIVQINQQIPGMEAGGNIANDLRDMRHTRVSQLAQYMNINAFEQENGTLTIVTAKGYNLVNGSSSYDLATVTGGEDGVRVHWRGSGDSTADITDHISSGMMGGWLEMRDVVISKYQKDLNGVAKEFTWAVNKQHSQGVGLAAFSSTTGTSAVAQSDEELGTEDSGLDFYDKITNGSFKLWVYGSDGTLDTENSITVDADAGGTTLEDIRDAIGAIANITASITADGELKIDADAAGGYEFAFSDDSSNVLAALGINTFFTGSSAVDMGLSTKISSDKNFIAAAQVNSDGTFATGDNTNATAVAELQYVSMDIPQWTMDRVKGDSEGSLTATIEDYYHYLTGSLGSTSAGISRGLDVNEEMVKRLSDIRNSISAVSIDEEMTNIIKFQQAYSAAAKLIVVADEMLDTLIGMK